MKRVILLVIASAVLGLGTTVGVAWTCACMVDVSRAPESRASSDVVGLNGFTGWVDLERWSCPGATFYCTYALPEFTPALHRGRADASRQNLDRVLDEAEPWATAIVLPWITGSAPWPATGDWRTVDARGWPLLALWCEYGIDRSTRPQQRTVSGGIVLHGRSSPKGPYRNAYPVALPLRPIWAGLLIDSSIYGCGCFVLLAAPGAICRRLREHRRRCPACGYSRAGLAAAAPCPECGGSGGTQRPVAGDR